MQEGVKFLCKKIPHSTGERGNSISEFSLRAANKEKNGLGVGSGVRGRINITFHLNVGIGNRNA